MPLNRGTIREGVEYALAHNCHLTMARVATHLRHARGLDYNATLYVINKIAGWDAARRVEELLLQASQDSEVE